MEQEQLNTPFSKSVMAGLFAGLIATFGSLAYNLIYRQIVDFELSALVNVATIVFIIPLLLLIAGIIYDALCKYKPGKMLYIIMALLFTGLCIVIDFHIQRSADPVSTIEFRKLLLGIIIISGLSSLLIPYLVNHETSII